MKILKNTSYRKGGETWKEVNAEGAVWDTFADKQTEAGFRMAATILLSNLLKGLQKSNPKLAEVALDGFLNPKEYQVILPEKIDLKTEISKIIQEETGVYNGWHMDEEAVKQITDGAADRILELLE